MLPLYVGLALFAAATLLLEISLTRIFALAQFYHFAFLAVSLALLGFGASGTVLTLRPHWRQTGWERRLAILAALFVVTDIIGYLLTNYLPFDSFSIAWDRRQVVYLLLYFLLPALPLGCAGLAVGLALAAAPAHASRLYGANLIGSALGCLAAIAVPAAWGPRAIPLSAGLAAVAGVLFAYRTGNRRYRLLHALLCVACALLVWHPPPFFDVRLSPYKGLRQALLYPDARIVHTWWNAYARVDLVESGGVRLWPGLSYTYDDKLPQQWGITVDGDDLSPVPLAAPENAPPFADYLPAAVAYRLHPQAKALILGAKGGLDVLAAVALGAQTVIAQEENDLVLQAAMLAAPKGIYASPSVQMVRRDLRSFLHATPHAYDVIQLALTQPFRPVTSGAFSLAETYSLTVEAFTDYLRHLTPDGLLVVTRWLQTPPSEELRTLALALAALEAVGIQHPRAHVIAFRSIQTVSLLVKRTPFTPDEVDFVRAFAEARRYDMVAAPALQVSDANRYNVQPEPLHFTAFNALLDAADRSAYLAAYPFAVAPPTDDRPFFFHFFRWGQTPAILQNLGRTWQPFGGSGYFVLLVLLALTALAALILIVLPLALHRRRFASLLATRRWARPFLYFFLLGIGFLWLEIPLVGRHILFLAHPAYAFAGVLFSLLLFSGLGSLLAPRLHWHIALGALALAGGAMALLMPSLLYRMLGWPLWARFAATVLTLAPLGFLMGIPFPKGLAWLESHAPQLIPWAWAVNGSISVIASVLAAILTLAMGYQAVMLLGSVAYALAIGPIALHGSGAQRARP